MNKYALLKKNVAINAAISAAGCGLFALIYFLVGSYAEDADARRTNAENALSADQSMISSLGNQIRNSGTAEKRFYEIQLQHINPEFAANTEHLKDWLREEKSQYRFSPSFKLSLSIEQPTKENDLKNLEYKITTRADTKLALEAISDVHVFSFLDDLANQAPGIIRVDKVSMKRKGEIDAVTVSQLQAGFTPFLVDAEVSLTWIGVTQKETTDASPPVTGGGR